MKWRRYPQYKDSGIEWLGEIPDGWEVIRFKYAMILQRGYDLSTNLFDEGEFPVCASNGIIGFHNKFTTKGPSITVGRSGSVGEVKYIEKNFWAHNTALYVRVFIRSEPKFGYYLLKTLDVKYLSEGTAVGTLNRNNIHSLYIALPNFSEQRSIATFLDRETSRIDKLIEKKEKQIELLKEKRAALISHAVTKGLDPNVKMKDSGIQWLGEIPEGWDLIRIKRVVAKKITDGPHETPPLLEEGVPFISAEAIKNNRIDFSLKRGFISEELHNIYCKKVKPRRDDIFLIKSGATTGNIAMVGTDEEFSIWSPLAMIRADQKVITPKFLFYYLQTDEFKKIIELSWSFGTQQNIGMGVIENLHCIIPPISYQKEITEILDRETRKIDILIKKVQKSIETLKEYRTAIISAAVTGKIDVRGTV